MTDEISLFFGVLAPPLSEQLKAYPLTEKQVELFEEDRKAISRAYVRGYLSEAEKGRVYQRLIKAIAFTIKAERKRAEKGS